jgi:ornithine cyclodeaminase/alanine dehydrogenase-like protein (mu-crystallin family)
MRLLDNAEVDAAMTWAHVIEAMRNGHKHAQPKLSDTLLVQDPNSILVRTAWIGGMGLAVKAATIYPANPDRSPALPSVQGYVMVFDDVTGSVTALIDAVSVTRWKTAGDSALGSSLLSRPDSRHLLMVGAGTMAEPLIRAHLAVRSNIQTIEIWNRSRPRAQALAAKLADIGRPVRITTELDTAVAHADIISVATMSTEPLIRGEWLKPGTHLDLVGAYAPAMREADSEAVRRSRVFCDYRETTIDHIGDLLTPIQEGVITRDHILGDLYDLVPGGPGRASSDDITLFENGGGAHLDLMTCHAILAATA